MKVNYRFMPKDVPAGIYLHKVNRNTRTRCEWNRYGVFIVDFEHILHLDLVFLFLTLNV